ncbi:unnamed protein product [Ectocarpus sp. CCAP 1310/34]|nr:unnamed protein product [Ectocarpus sp. CCAP 1310/34]
MHLTINRAAREGEGLSFKPDDAHAKHGHSPHSCRSLVNVQSEMEFLAAVASFPMPCN